MSECRKCVIAYFVHRICISRVTELMRKYLIISINHITFSKKNQMNTFESSLSSS